MNEWGSQDRLRFWIHFHPRADCTSVRGIVSFLSHTAPPQHFGWLQIVEHETRTGNSIFREKKI